MEKGGRERGRRGGIDNNLVARLVISFRASELTPRSEGGENTRTGGRKEICAPWPVRLNYVIVITLSASSNFPGWSPLMNGNGQPYISLTTMYNRSGKRVD